jgi:hypothetical protein
MGMFDEFLPKTAPPGPAPGAWPGAQSAPVGPVPANGIPATALEEMTKGSAAESNDALTQAQGGIESLQHLQRLRAMVAAAPEQAFGITRGTDLWNRGNSIAGMLPQIGGQAGPSGSDLVSWHEQLKGAYNDAALPMVKQLYGAVPRSPELVDKALEVLGGPTLSDKDTALKRIDAAMQDANDKVNRGIALGRVSPGSLPQRLAPAPAAGVVQWERGPDGIPRPVK